MVVAQVDRPRSTWLTTRPAAKTRASAGTVSSTAETTLAPT